MSARRYFRLDMRLLGGGRYGRGTTKVTRTGESSQRCARRTFVIAQLCHKGGHVGKPLDVAQLRDEGDLHDVAVKIPGHIEEVRLDGPAFVVEGRTTADAEHPAEQATRGGHL